MADYDEIMIARRLFRDGDSQYELNNVACRLSDIVDFFLDTGVGKNSYAIIEQGRVDMVVASKPEDRRVLIEEAAGINRYKSRKEAAVKKLEQTQQNLTRIKDVVSEVKRQSAALRRQASKAERYRKLADQLRETDLAINSWRCNELNREMIRIKEQLEQERIKLSENETIHAELSAQLEANKLEALETDEQLKKLLESSHQINVELTAVRGLVEKNRTGIAQYSEQRKRSKIELQELEEKSKAAAETKVSLEKSRKLLGDDIELASAELKRAFAEMRAADQGLNEERKRAERLKEDVFRALQEAAQERNRLAGLVKRVKEIDISLQRLANENLSAALSLEKDKVSSAQIEASIQETESQRSKEIRRRDQLVASREESRKTVAVTREAIAGLERNLAASKAPAARRE
jgi:chromosome segregation protein